MTMGSIDALTRSPYANQIKYLRRILKNNRDTEYGKRFRFDKICNERDYKKNVPVNKYEDLEPYIEKMTNGCSNVLISDKVIMFNLTSGTSDKPKYIPVTARVRRLTSSHMRRWLHWTLTDHPACLDKSLLFISGSAAEGYTGSNVPYGALSGLINNGLPGNVRSSSVLPPAAANIRDYELRYYLIARLAAAKDISFAATPNPLTLIKVAESAIKHQDEIIRSIRDGCLFSRDFLQISSADNIITKKIDSRLSPDPDRAKFLERIAKNCGRLLPGRSWPSLKVIGCWLGGSIGYHAGKLKEFYGDIPLRDLGYMASEGCITLPYEDSTASGILALQNNFYEFVPEETEFNSNTETLLCHELEAGKYYRIILTNESGLYRYDLNDTVRVDKFYNSTPVLSFVRKTGDVLNITGEKIHVNQLIMTFQHISSAFNLKISQFRVVSNLSAIRYDIFIGIETVDRVDRSGVIAKLILPAIDSFLKKVNIEYALKRETGRLNPPCLHLMDSSWEDDVKKVATESGMRDIQGKWKIISHEPLVADQRHVLHTVSYKPKKSS